MKISVIIPTYNEQGRIGKLVDEIHNSNNGHIHEIIVVDGGSEDNTVNEAKRSYVRLIESTEKGRAIQMNEAASMATGDILYFVHADTRPPKGFDNLIVEKYGDDNRAGCFTSIFDWNHPFLRFCNFFSKLPFWFCRGGGQTLFVCNSLFHKLGGFKTEMSLMEEYEFIGRLKKETNFTIIKKNAITSARDYRKNGAVRLQLIYAYVFYLYAIGASQERMLNFLKERVMKPSKSCS
ncbi:MAG TPA: TIGR04283 family arsenosugar biosynthesis glycosyltransferase [Fulvivirga sp.]|nr:TIGR04283 family arsenosugar biosynthesis glycosyltransferase [Fulvivirga sp.]